MKAQKITIRSENALFQQIDALKRSREKRRAQRRFLVEGVQPLTLALANGWHFEAILFAAGRKLSSWAQKFIKECGAGEQIEIAAPLFAKLSDKDAPSELLALLTIQSRRLDALKVSPQSLIVVLDRPASPGNLGSTIRSADAFGVDGIIISGHAVDPYDPQVIRSSVGTFFAQHVASIESHSELMEWKNKQAQQGIEFKIVGTSALAATNISEADFSKPLIVLFGNETAGLSKGYKEISDEIVRIPIAGAASSLNVSCAASIVLYEARRDRRR